MKARKSNLYRFSVGTTLAEQRAADQFLAALRGHDPRGLSASAANDLPEPASSAPQGEALESDEGERQVHSPQLLAHTSSGSQYDLRGDNCVVRWANLRQGYTGNVDVVVHFHGFQAHDAMRLASKAAASGVDLDVAGSTRPSVGLIPHGHAYPALRRCGTARIPCPRSTWRAPCPGSTTPVLCQDGFDFPALESRADLLRFVQTALAEVARERGSSGLSCGRLIVTGHSGGGAHLSKLIQAFRTADEISAFQFFDATYSGESSITDRDGWLDRALRRDAAALTGMSETDWPSHMRRAGGHLRLAFIEGGGTASVATNVDRFIQGRLREIVPNETQRAFLRRYYRAQSTIGLGHNAIPNALGGRLLLEPSDDFRGVLRDLPAVSAARRPRRDRPARAAAPTEHEAFDEQSEDQHIEVDEAIDATLSEQGPINTAPLAQADIDRLARIAVTGTRDLNAFFARGGQPHFAAWYNAELAGQAPFTRRTHAIRMPTSAEGRRRFDGYWDQIQSAYGRTQITLLDFAATMCIVLNETGGQFEAFPERCGNGRSDARGRHPGLAYAFDRIIDVKLSYNTLSSNRSAGTLFNDAEFIRAHGQLPGGAALAGRGDELDRAWHGELFPQQAFSPDEDPTRSGFIMQADFYKFRGRGVIQTTGRNSYLAVIRFIQRYQGTSTLLRTYADRWRGLSEHSVATLSTTQDWDRLFDDPEILASGPALHGRQGNVDFRIMDLRADVLNHVPDASGNPRGTAGSIYALGRRVSGRHRYGAGIYRDRVLGLLNTALALV